MELKDFEEEENFAPIDNNDDDNYDYTDLCCQENVEDYDSPSDFVPLDLIPICRLDLFPLDFIPVCRDKLNKKIKCQNCSLY